MNALRSMAATAAAMMQMTYPTLSLMFGGRGLFENTNLPCLGDWGWYSCSDGPLLWLDCNAGNKAMHGMQATMAASVQQICPTLLPHTSARHVLNLACIKDSVYMRQTCL